MPAITSGAPFARSAMAYVLAGGRGTRLLELTDWRAKPAVHFGGKSRIIDFALSNALNSGIRRIGVATQYKAHSLIRHLQRGWNFFRHERNESFDILPASQRVVGRGVVRRHRRRGLSEHRHHRELRAEIHRHPGRRPHLQDGLRADARAARGAERRRDGRLPRGSVAARRRRSASCMSTPTIASLDFVEKPEDPPPMPGRPDMALASMGVYVFDTAFLFDQLRTRRGRSAFQP